MLHLRPTGASEQVRKYLVDFSHLYPGIEDWYERIRPEFSTGARSLVALKLNGAICGIAITRNGERAKLCHISISQSVRFHGLGQLLLHAASRELVAHGSHSVHVTTGEEVAGVHAEFFSRHGFKLTEEHKNRYRHGHSELVWKASPRALLESSRHVAFNALNQSLESSSELRTFVTSASLGSTKGVRVQCFASSNVIWHPLSKSHEHHGHARDISAGRGRRLRDTLSWRAKF